MLSAKLVATLITRAIRPGLQTITVLFIFLPIALILGAVEVAINSHTVRFVILPLTVIYVTVCVDQSTSAVGLAICPVALVQRTIRPYLNALTLAYLGTFQPLAFVLHSILEEH